MSPTTVLPGSQSPKFFFRLALLLACACFALIAQTTGGVRGVITDQARALVPGAQVLVTSETGAVSEVTAGADGSWILNGLASGAYSIRASAPGLSQPEAVLVQVNGDGAVATVNIVLREVLARQEVTVQDDAAVTVDTDPHQSAASMAVSGDSLDSLADDPDDLQADLVALAGPAAGSAGAQFYIDGFTAGDAPLPAKSAIREIRVNQNPFSPEYDVIGYGRTEILTKPGSDKFRGQVYLNYGNDFFNSRNPYAQAKAPLDLKEPGGSLGGPLNKRSSFFVDVSDRLIGNGSIVDAIVVNPTTFAVNPFTTVVTGPARRFRISPRLDYQLSKNNTLVFRYALTSTDTDATGTGGFNLATRAVNQTLVEHAFQATETAVLASNVVDETHFQFLHQHEVYNSPDTDPSINVVGAFSGGGPANSDYYYIHHHYEVSNYVSVVSGKHTIKTGIRVRAVSIQDFSKAGFDGTWTFSSIQQYQQALINNSKGLPATATQFSVNTGNPLVLVGQVDAGIFAGDDWRVKQNLTFSYGLRYETQTNIPDHADFAPRLALAWAPGPAGKGRQKTVIRAGSGIFYDRFNEQNILIAERFDGVNQQQFIVLNPTTYPNVPVLTSTLQTVHTVSSQLRAPYVIQSALGVERQLPSNTTLAVTWTNSHALHHLMSQNINAPLAGTYPGNPVYPFPGQGPILEMESSGLYNQNQLVTNVNTRVTRQISLFGYYMLNYAYTNADSVNTFPGNPNSSSGEYSRASNDIRNRATIGGQITAPWDLRLSPLVTLQSGAPFNITVPTDIYGDTIADARPGIATNPNLPGLIQTSYGLLDPNPRPGEAILPRNAGNGPGLYNVDLRIAKTFYFKRGKPHNAAPVPGAAGPAAPPPPEASQRRGIGGFEGQTTAVGDAGGDKNYNLTFSVSIRNLLNHTNPGQIVGTLGSPLFGQSNQIAGGLGAFSGNASNRRLEFQGRFAF